MYMMARLYASEDQANAAISALIEAGVSSDSIEMLSNTAPAPVSAAPVTAGETDAAEAAPAPVPAQAQAQAQASEAFPESVAKAVKVGKMLGEQADFYLSRLDEGRSLVVAKPHFMMTGKAESILDAHDPLPISHLPEPEKFVPVKEQAAPFSSLLGIPALASGTFSEAMGFGFKEEGVSQLSQTFSPLKSGWTFSSLLGMKTLSDGPTPLSSKLGLPVSSDRKGGSLTKRKRFISP